MALLLTARRQRYTERTRATPRPPSCSAPDQAPVWLAGLYALERLAYSTWMTEVDTEVPPTEAQGVLGPRRITLACPEARHSSTQQ